MDDAARVLAAVALPATPGSSTASLPTATVGALELLLAAHQDVLLGTAQRTAEASTAARLATIRRLLAQLEALVSPAGRRLANPAAS